MKVLHPLTALFLLAEPTVPLPLTGSWFVGLLGALGCVYLVLGVWSQARKIFSRRPPIDEDLARLDARMSKKIDELAGSVSEVQADRERRWLALQNEISELCERFAFLEGQLTGKPPRHRRML